MYTSSSKHPIFNPSAISLPNSLSLFFRKTKGTPYPHIWLLMVGDLGFTTIEMILHVWEELSRAILFVTGWYTFHCGIVIWCTQTSGSKWYILAIEMLIWCRLLGIQCWQPSHCNRSIDHSRSVNLSFGLWSFELASPKTKWPRRLKIISHVWVFTSPMCLHQFHNKVFSISFLKTSNFILQFFSPNAPPYPYRNSCCQLISHLSPWHRFGISRPELCCSFVMSLHDQPGWPFSKNYIAGVRAGPWSISLGCAWCQQD